MNTQQCKVLDREENKVIDNTQPINYGNIFDILNKGYEYCPYIINIQRQKQQVYQQSIDNMMTITTFTIQTEVGFDDILITLDKNSYMTNCCHINIKNQATTYYVPNISINYALYELLLGTLDDLYIQFYIKQNKDKIKLLEEEYDNLTDTMVETILRNLTQEEIALLSKSISVDEDIFENTIINWDWQSISENPNLTLEFIQKNYDKLSLDTLVKYNTNFLYFIQYGE